MTSILEELGYVGIVRALRFHRATVSMCTVWYRYQCYRNVFRLVAGYGATLGRQTDIQFRIGSSRGVVGAWLGGVRARLIVRNASGNSAMCTSVASLLCGCACVS